MALPTYTGVCPGRSRRDAANQLTVQQTPSALTTYTGVYPERSRRDANGNLTLANAAGDRTTYSWDIENMLTQAALPDDTLTTFAYDGDKRRRRKTEAGVVTNFLRDGERVVLEADSNWTTQARYTLQGGGWFDLLVSMRRGATSFHHGVYPERSRRDALGSADRFTDSSQAVTDSYLHKAFGILAASTGSTVDPFRFVARFGYYRDPSTDLLQLGVRHYAPPTGRFITRDPVRAPNLYLYAANSPVANVDPSGMQRSVAVGGPTPQPFPVYPCPDKQDWCCELPWGLGPPRRFDFGAGSQVVKDVWHTDIECALPTAGREGHCAGIAHMTVQPTRRGELVGGSGELTKRITGNLVRCSCVASPAWQQLRPYQGPSPWTQDDASPWAIHGPYYKPPRIKHYYEPEVQRIDALWGIYDATLIDQAMWSAYMAGAVSQLATFPNAARALMYYLSPLGGERRLPLDQIYASSTSMRRILEKDRLDILLWARSAPLGRYHLADGTYEHVLADTPDWYKTVGGMVLWPEAYVEILCAPDRKAIIRYTLHLYDPYWQHARPDDHDPGNPELHQLHLVGLGRSFVHVGELHVTWKFP